MILAMRNDIPAGEIFHLVDDDILSREQLARLYIAAREPRLRLMHVPMVAVTSVTGVLRGVTRLLGRPLGPSSYRLRSGVAPLPCDCTKAHTELGWKPTVKSGTALRALLRPSL
jgi:nucleoside-diphosphate-sugar epimerase